MGLDISAYKGLSFAAPGAGIDEDGEVDDAGGYFQIYLNKDFPARAADLPDPCVCASSQDSMGFRAGSYSGYSAWREALARMAGYAGEGHTAGDSSLQAVWDAQEGPFWELIVFSDCEGAIGPSVSAKLSADFESNREKAVAFAEGESDGEYFLSRYESFAQAFAMAADGGAVCFH